MYFERSRSSMRQREKDECPIFKNMQQHYTNLNCHVAHDCPLMTFKGLQCNLSNVLFRLPQELLACSLQHFFILTLYFHLITSDS